jgi:putative ABC transport system permease protein
MSLFDAIRHRLTNALRRDDADRQRAEEYAFHESLESNDAGAPREFSNTTYLKEEVRWMGAARWLDAARQDLSYAWRALRRSPALTLVSVGSLGLGIGANAVIFGMIHALLLAKLPVANPETLRLVTRAPDGPMRAFFTSSETDALRTSGRFALATFHFFTSGAEMNGVAMNAVNMDAVDGAFFRVAGVRVAAGRAITPADVEGAAQVAVLSHASASRYGGDRSALGKTIKINDVLFTIVGVTSAGYEGLSLGGQYEMAIPMTAVAAILHQPGTLRRRDLFMLARANADSVGMLAALEATFTRCCANGELASQRPRDGVQRIGLLDVSTGISEGKKIDIRQQYRGVLLALMAGVAVLLLIACTNVSNLLMARAAARARELAVRLALGASRSRIVRQMLVESLLLATIGAVSGLVLALWGSAVLSRHLPPGLGVLGPFVTLRPGLTIVAFTAGAAMVCALIFGVVPAMRATRGDVVSGLRDDNAAGRKVRALDRAIVCIQVGLALLLVSAAGLLTATLEHLTASVGGSNPETLLVVQVDSRGTVHSDTLLRSTVPILHARFAAVPGVKLVAESYVVPLIYGGLPIAPLDAPGFEAASDADVEVANFPVAPRYFETLGIPLLAGRDFNEDDVIGAPRVVVVSEHLARQFFADKNAIGQTIGFRGGQRDMTIVGIVADAKQTDLRSPAPNTVYLAWQQSRSLQGDRAVFAIRTTVPPAQLVAPIRSIILDELPKIRIRHVHPMSELLATNVSKERVLASLAVSFGALALVLAAIGLYGVMAFQVSARTREIGVRMALGAGRAQVVRMVIGEALSVVAIGVGIGIPIALAGARSLRALLYGITPFDPAPLATGAAVLLIVGTVAALIPSRTAACVDPLIAMRAE